MQLRGHGRLVLFVLLMVAAGSVATVSAPPAWHPVWQGVVAAVAAIAAGAAGTFVGEAISTRRKIAEAKDAPRQALDAVDSRPASDQSVAALLRPERAVVEFTGRQDELRRLREWCTEDGSCPVHLVTGPGGVGKTRLALALAQALSATKWTTRQVQHGTEVDAVSAAVDLQRPILLVVDYAETRPDLPAMLAAIADHKTDGRAHGLRVLLLARDVGEWWTNLRIESDATGVLVGHIPILRLPPALDGEHDSHRIVNEALPFFAEARGRAIPQVELTLEAADPPVLVLHAAALVAVLDDEAGTGGGHAAADLGVLDRLLTHEIRLWDKSARRSNLAVPLPVLQQVITAVTLTLDSESPSEAALRHTIRRVPDLADADEVTVGALIRWLRQLYPTATGRMETLRPDLLAEHHAANQLTEHEQLRQECFTDLSHSQAIQALTVLTRACAHHSQAEALLDEVLRHDLPGLADAAITVATQTGTVLGDHLADAMSNAEVAEEDLRRIASAIPYPSVALAAAHLSVTRRIRQSLPPDALRQDIAYWNASLSRSLAQAGRREEALEAGTEAVTVYRDLAEQRPDTHRPNLAGSLNNQSGHLRDLGRREEALAASTEAVTIWRDLAEQHPDTHRPNLAVAIHNHANSLALLGQREEALEAVTEAVTIRRELAEQHPAAFNPDLAASLNNQSNLLEAVGRWEEALEASTEAVTVYRDLAEQHPDTHRPNLATALFAQSKSLSGLDRWEEALEASTEAVTIRRDLAERHPDTFTPDLATSLITQPRHLAAVGRREEALEASTEAVTLYRDLAEQHPATHRPDLAMALNNHANSLALLGQWQEALEASTEAVTIRRDLAEQHPDAVNPDLAASLNNQALCLGKLGRYEEALQSFDEALAIGRELAARLPEVHQDELDRLMRNHQLLVRSRECCDEF